MNRRFWDSMKQGETRMIKAVAPKLKDDTKLTFLPAPQDGTVLKSKRILELAK